MKQKQPEPINILEFLKPIVKQLLEEIMLEERRMFKEQNPESVGNGFYERELTGIFGNIENLRVPRTRDSKFRSSIIPYRKRMSPELEELIFYLFQANVSTRKIGKILEMMYGKAVSHQTVSRIIDVSKEVIEKWRKRKLDEFYPVIFLDAFFFPIRRFQFKKEPIYIVYAIKRDGTREVLGFWIFGSEGESGKLWEEILSELKERGVKRVGIFVSDGLKGLKEAVFKVFPETNFQLCWLHITRNIMNKVRKIHREEIAYDLRTIYTSENEKEARERLKILLNKWKKLYPKTFSTLEKEFEFFTTFLKFPEPIRKFIYTTNSLERLIKEIKRRLKIIELLHSQESAEKILFIIISDLNKNLSKHKLPHFEFFFNKYHEN